MKKIKLDGIEYNCPESWQEITLKQQMQVSEDSNSIKLDDLKKLAIISGYCGIPQNKLKHARLQELGPLFKNIEFINKPIPNNPVIEFDFNDKHYHVGQNLIDMEFQDFISIQNAIQNVSGNTFLALPTIIAIMCKCKKEDGRFESIDDYDVEKRAKEFEQLPITIANGIAFFFSNSTNLLSTITLLYSNPIQLVTSRLEDLENTLRKQDGQGWLTRLHNSIFRRYIKSIKKRLPKYFTS